MGNRHLGVIIRGVAPHTHKLCQAKVAPFIWRLQDANQHLDTGWYGGWNIPRINLLPISGKLEVNTVQMFKQLGHFGHSFKLTIFTYLKISKSA